MKTLDQPELRSECPARGQLMYNMHVPVKTPELVHQIPAKARREVNTALCDWGLAGLCDNVNLLTSELVTNACLAILQLRNCPEPCSIRLLLRPIDIGLVLLEITDPVELSLPIAHCPAHLAESGRGLYLVDSFSCRWGVRPDPRGKTVWAEIDGSTPSPDPADSFAEFDLDTAPDL